ncbi:MAG: TRAP transporter substrate-binding protein, partial [Caldimonas sp.]
TAGRFPRVEVFELPFIMTNAEATSKAYWEYVQTQAPDEFKETQTIALHVHGPGMFHSATKLIKSPGDLRGMKVRGPTRQITKMLGALGATPVGMPLPQIPDALSKGTIDACVIPWEVVPSIKVDELTKNHTEFPANGLALYTTTFVMAMNKPKYESLSPELKKVIDANSGLATSAWLGKTQQGNDPNGRKISQEKGGTIYTLSDAEAQPFHKVAGPIEDEWAADMNKRGFDGKKLLQSARDLIAKHGKG